MATPTLAVIHTTQVTINTPTLKDLFQEIIPHVRIVNILDDSLLPEAIASNGITPGITDRICMLVNVADKGGADAVLSACSSVGPSIDEARKHTRIPLIKIDDAMAETAVLMGDRIGVLATVATTLDPTVNLLKEKATSLKKEVQLESCLVQGAYEAVLNGKRTTHDELILKAGQEMAAKVDILVFAQASMTSLAGLLSEKVGKTVLTSPRLGIERTKEILQQIPTKKITH